MANYKIVIRYKFATRGFSEVFYKTSQDSPEVIAGGYTQFLLRSLACRHPGVVAQSVTVSDVAIPRRAALHTYNMIAQGVAGATPDVTAVSARISFNAVGGGNRKLWLRGLNDTWTVRDAAGNDTPSPALVNRLRDYIDFIINSGHAMQRLQGVDAQPWKAVSSVSGTNVNGKMWLSIQRVDGFVGGIGEQFIVSRFPQNILGGFKGIFKVIAANPPFNTMNYAWDLAGAISMPTGARMRAAVYDYPLIASGQFQQFSTHDTGRPTDLPRGRRKGLTVRR